MNSWMFTLTIINGILFLVIAIFMLLGAVGFYRDWRNGVNGFTAVLMVERFLLFCLFVGQFFAGMGTWYYNEYLQANREFLLLWVLSFKVLVVINIIGFYREAKRAKHH